MAGLDRGKRECAKEQSIDLDCQSNDHEAMGKDFQSVEPEIISIGTAETERAGRLSQNNLAIKLDWASELRAKGLTEETVARMLNLTSTGRS